MKTFKDKGSTRIQLEAITSYSKDFDLLPPSGKSDTIILTIGSAVRKMTYNSTETRDQDFKALDDHFNVDLNLR